MSNTDSDTPKGQSRWEPWKRRLLTIGIPVFLFFTTVYIDVRDVFNWSSQLGSDPTRLQLYFLHAAFWVAISVLSDVAFERVAALRELSGEIEKVNQSYLEQQKYILDRLNDIRIQQGIEIYPYVGAWRDLDEEFAGASELIVTGSSLRRVLDRQEPIKRLAEKGCKCTFILLAPNSDAVDKIYRQELTSDPSNNEYRKTVAGSLANFDQIWTDLGKPNRKNLECYLSETVPTVSVLIARYYDNRDPITQVEIYLPKHKSDKRPRFKVTPSVNKPVCDLFGSYVQHLQDGNKEVGGGVVRYHALSMEEKERYKLIT